MKTALQIAHVYDKAAPGYDLPALRFFPQMAARLVTRAGIRRGECVLDVGTGTGAAALAAALRVGNSGRVVGIDVSPGMLHQAHYKSRRFGLDQIAWRQTNAECMEFAAGSFDVILASCAFFFLSDPVAALGRWRNWLRPGGRIGISGFNARAFQPLADRFVAALGRFGVSTAPFPWQRFGAADDYRRLLAGAGYAEIRVFDDPLGYPLDAPEAWWDVLWNSGFRSAIELLPVRDLPQFKTAHLAEIARQAGRHPIRLDVPALLAVARA